MSILRNASQQTLSNHISPSSSRTRFDRIDAYKSIPQEPDLEAQLANFEPLELEPDNSGSSIGYGRVARTGFAIGGGTAAAVLSPLISIPTGYANAFVSNIAFNEDGGEKISNLVFHNARLATTVLTAVAAATLAATAIGLGTEHKNTMTRATYSAAYVQAGLCAGGLVGAIAGYMVQAGASTLMSEEDGYHALPHAGAVGGVSLGLLSAVVGAACPWINLDG